MKEKFIAYIDKYCPWLGYIKCSNGTFFLVCNGCECGDVTDKGLEWGGKFSDPNSIDKSVREMAKEFTYPRPTVSFKQFLNEKN